MTIYVNGDIRSIQEFIFASPRLLEMRGASSLIDFFDRAVVPELADRAGGKVVFTGGGNFMTIFDGPKAEQASDRFAEAVRTAFLDLTGGHGLALAQIASDQPFREALPKLREQMRRAKRRSTQRQQLASMPFLKRCESCGRESADRTFSRPGAAAAEPPMWLGLACARKRKMSAALREAAVRGQGRRAQQPVFNLLEGHDIELPVPTVTEGLADAELPANFQELVGDDDLGIVVADGNGVGGWFDDLELEEYRELSDKVDLVLRGSLDGAADAVFGNEHRLQVLICGGDDLVVALPGRKALRFAQEILRRFRVCDSGRTAGVAVGVTLCRNGFPFRQAHDLAGALVRQAKARCRSEGLLSALAFHRITGSQMQSLEREQAAVERHDGRANGWSYGAAGPYAAGPGEDQELESLLELKRALERVPRSQLGRLREILSPRDDGPSTPLDPIWKVPARTVAELKTWLARQKDPPFSLPEGGPPRQLIRSEERRVGKNTIEFRRVILADALMLAGRCEG